MFGRATERHMTPTAKILLLGSGELGREFVISAKRLGCHIIACDSYAGAPAMQVADAFEVFSMLDGDALRAAIEKHRPRSEEHTSELQSLMRISYAVFCLKKKRNNSVVNLA